MRTRIMKLARGGVSIAFVATGLGVVGALGAGLATSGVASAAPGPTDHVAATCTTPGPTLTLTFPFHVTTVPASVQKTTHQTATTQIVFFLSPTLVGLAAATTTWTLAVTSATIHVKPTGLTTNVKQAEVTATARHVAIAHHKVPVTVTTVIVTKTEPNPATTHSGNTGHPVITTGLTMTFSFTHSYHVTGTVGTTATFKSTGKIVIKVLTAVTVTCTPVAASETNIFTSPIVAFVVPPVTLTPASGALHAGQGTAAYAPVTFTAGGGAGGFTWTEAGTLDGLVFAHTGSHATLSGTPHHNVAPVTVAFTVTATTTPTATKHATNHYTIHIAASPLTTPAFSLLQPFRLTVTPGTITMTCTSTVAHTAKPNVAHDVTSQALAATCALVHLGKFKLNEQRHIITGWGHSLIISTARGASTDDWALSAIMVPTSHTLTGNTNCNIVPGFCNKTTTTAGNNKPTLPHYRNTSITPNYLYLTDSHCRPNNTLPSTPYFNTNTPPTNKAPQNPATLGTHGLAVSHEICTAATGSSGGQFFATTLGYTLIAPGDIYAGVYYGTVQYTLTPSGIKPVVTVTPLTNFTAA
jgi:hypothetical protein